MLIESIEVYNFRSIKNAVLNCDNLTVVIGRNGAGKSSFFKALEFFYDVSAEVTEEDFYNREIETPIQICVTYGDLTEDEKNEFKSYIKDNRLIVTKRLRCESNKIIQNYYAKMLQIPKFAEIRAIASKRDRIKAWNDLVESGEPVAIGGRVKNSDDIDMLMLEYENSYPELMVPIEREEQFFGPKNIGGGKLDNYTKFVFVPAVREASDEITGKKGAIYQILEMIVLRKINMRKDIQEFRVEFEDKVKKLYCSENLKELPELGSSISKTLELFAPGAELKLDWDEAKLPEVPLPKAKGTLIEDNFEGEISRKGHGLQRALILSLLQHLALIMPSKQVVDELEEKATINNSEFLNVPDLIMAIEEPELYLHPSRCYYLSELLHELVKRDEYEENARNQILYTSHSPYFIDLKRFDQIRLIRKIISNDAIIPQSVVKRYSLIEAAKKLAEINDDDPNKYTEESFKAHALPVMNTIINEGFFADLVVVVEGLSDVGALWKLQEIMKKEWSKLGIVIVPAGGINNLDRPVVIFRGFEIPTYFIFDADSKYKGKKEENKVKVRNHRYLKLAGAKIEDFPCTHVGSTWAVFEDDIEKEFESNLSKEIYDKFQNQVAIEYGYDKDPKRACKNIEGSARLLEIVYENGFNVPILEEVVDKITDLNNNVERCQT